MMYYIVFFFFFYIFFLFFYFIYFFFFFFFFQAEDGIRDGRVTGVQDVCSSDLHAKYDAVILANGDLVHQVTNPDGGVSFPSALADSEWLALSKFEQTYGIRQISDATFPSQIGRASCRERV